MEGQGAGAGTVRGARLATPPPHPPPTTLFSTSIPVPLPCMELWVGAASGDIHTSPEMLTCLPHLSQDTTVT